MNTSIKKRIEKLEGQLHIKEVYSAEDIHRMAVWRKCFDYPDSTSDEEIYKAMQIPLTHYIDELDRKENKSANNECNN